MIAEQHRTQIDDKMASLMAAPGPQSKFDHADERIHVLFLIDELCEAGGAERVLLDMVRRLPKQRFRCSIATFRLNSSIEIFRNLPCPAYVFPMRRSYGWSGLHAARKLRKLIRSERVQIVHTFHETSDLWGGLVAKLSGCPVVVSSRRDMGILRSAKHQMAYRLMSPLFDQVLTVSEEVRKFCINNDKLPLAKVATLHNGIDLPAAPSMTKDHLRRKFDLPQNARVILTVGNIRPVKGVDTFVRAAAIVRREFPQAIFLVVGDISDSEHYRQLQALNQEQGTADMVRFLGPSEEVVDYLRLSDVFCIPSRSEGFSNALLEAMACGIPCVATSVGGNVEAIEDAATGFLIPPNDPEAAADRIMRLLRDSKTATLMGRAARKTIEEQFTAAAMMSRLIANYEHLLKAAGKRVSQ